MLVTDTAAPSFLPSSVCSCSRRNPFSLLVAVDGNLEASGSLFLDDGETLNTYESGNYSLIEFTAQKVHEYSDTLK